MLFCDPRQLGDRHILELGKVQQPIDTFQARFTIAPVAVIT